MPITLSHGFGGGGGGGLQGLGFTTLNEYQLLVMPEGHGEGVPPPPPPPPPGGGGGGHHGHPVFPPPPVLVHEHSCQLPPNGQFGSFPKHIGQTTVTQMQTITLLEGGTFCIVMVLFPSMSNAVDRPNKSGGI